MLIPEVWIGSAIVLLIIGSLFKRIPPQVFYGFAMGVVLIEILLLGLHWPTTPYSLLGGMMRHDDFSSFFRVLAGIGVLLTLLIDHKRDRPADYYLLILSVLIGANFLVMSMNLVMVVLSLELISIPSYVLASGWDADAMDDRKKRAEASWKYFLFGSASTALMIFGMSYLFGFTGTLDFASPDFATAIETEHSPLLLVGALLTLAGFLFKVAGVPFHFWAPDVYQSAPTPVVALFSVVPKIAAIAILTKWVTALHAFGQSPLQWSLIIACVAIASILVGSLAALNQTDAKRMMAYSSVAQSGFLIAALSTLSLDGIHFGMFYAAVFVLMNFLTFQALATTEQNLGTTKMAEFSGWGYVGWLPSIGLLVGLVSLTGLPPTGGFMAKLFLFSALWENFADKNELIYLWLFAIGLLATVISLFFYLKMPYYLFLKRAQTGGVQKIGLQSNLLVILLVIVLLYFFFQPGLLMGWVNKINFVL
jgi:NADH-quinone oxidoreductase subunit N